LHRVLIIIVLIACVLSGCTKKSPQNFPTPSGGGRLDEQFTLEQAQEKVPFKIIMPHSPEGVAFKYAKIYDGLFGTNSVQNAKGSAVLLDFDADKQGGFLVFEQQGSMGHLDQANVTKVDVNKNVAEYSNDEKQFQPMLLWQEGDVVCLMYTTIRYSFANEKGLTEIASSFK
jgi:hypothetical protein